MHKKNVLTAGTEIRKAKKALIMIHGRGASAEDIIGLARNLNVEGYALIAPQATNATWYPYSFLAPPTQNEPWLSSAIDLLNEVVDDLNKTGIADNCIYFTGFSQGACLTAEYVARKARRWGGAAVFTGGLIGDRIYEGNYEGDFMSTPVFIGSSDPDPHVPVVRVRETSSVLRSMHASVTEKMYPGMGHTINQDEIETVNKHIFAV